MPNHEFVQNLSIFLYKKWHSVCALHAFMSIPKSFNCNSMTNRRLVGSGQPIKLIQVASNSELHGNQWNYLKLFPLIASGPQKPQKLTASKIK